MAVVVLAEGAFGMIHAASFTVRVQLCCFVMAECLELLCRLLPVVPRCSPLAMLVLGRQVGVLAGPLIDIQRVASASSPDPIIETFPIGATTPVRWQRARVYHLFEILHLRRGFGPRNRLNRVLGTELRLVDTIRSGL